MESDNSAKKILSVASLSFFPVTGLSTDDDPNLWCFYVHHTIFSNFAQLSVFSSCVLSQTGVILYSPMKVYGIKWYKKEEGVLSVIHV